MPTTHNIFTMKCSLHWKGTTAVVGQKDLLNLAALQVWRWLALTPFCNGTSLIG